MVPKENILHHTQKLFFHCFKNFFRPMIFLYTSPLFIVKKLRLIIS